MRAQWCRVLLVLTCTALIVSGCGGSRLTAEPAAAEQSKSVAKPPDAEEGNTLAAAGMGRKTAAPDPEAIAIALTTITVDTEGNQDQAVFQFSGSHVPGWAVQYVDRPVSNETGDVLPIPGQSVLEVLIREAPSPFRNEATYSGPPTVFTQETPQINVVQYTTSRLGITQAFIGVNAQHPDFTVSALTNPTRIVVDVSH